MKLYKNLSGDSGISAYEAGKDYIIIRFVHGPRYLYNYKKPGKAKTEKMKQLAVKGKGLSTFISTKVREDYAEKLD